MPAPRGEVAAAGAGRAPSRGVAVTGAAAAERRRRARPERPSRGREVWRRSRGTRGQRAPGAGGERARPGPESPGSARAWPGRGTGRGLRATRPGLRTGKKARFIAPEAAAWWRPTHSHRYWARAAEPGGERPRAVGRARLGSRAATPAGHRGPVRSLPRPSGSLLSRASLPPQRVLSSKYWARAQERRRSRALCFPVPCPRLLGSLPALLRLCRALLLGNSRPFAPFSWESGPGRWQGCECSGRTGPSPPAPAKRPRVGPGLRRRVGAPPALRPAGARADPAGNPCGGWPCAPRLLPLPRAGGGLQRAKCWFQEKRFVNIPGD